MTPKKKGGGFLAPLIIVIFVFLFAGLATGTIQQQSENIRHGATGTAAGCVCVSLLILYGIGSAAQTRKRPPK